MANYGHAKVDLGYKKMRRVNTLSNYALEQLAKNGMALQMRGNRKIDAKKVQTEAKYILERRKAK